jgi:hypothetical protein
MTPDTEARFVGAFILVPLALMALVVGVVLLVRCGGA